MERCRLKVEQVGTGDQELRSGCAALDPQVEKMR